MILDKLMHIKRTVAGGVVGAVLLAGLVGSAPALAGPPVWTIASVAVPTHLAPGSTAAANDDQIILRAQNASATPAEGEVTPIVIGDTLPPGLSATGIEGRRGKNLFSTEELSCTLSPLQCTYAGMVTPYEALEVVIGVDVDKEAPSGGLNHGSISGGGTRDVSVAEPVTVSATPAGFGIEHADLVATNEDGSTDTQAGSHPYQLTSTIYLNQKLERPGGFTPEPEYLPSALAPGPVSPAKDIQFELPPGLVGNATVVAQCSDQAFTTATDNGAGNECPDDTAIGVAAVSIGLVQTRTFVVPLFNLVPHVGEPARMGFQITGIHVYLDTSVRTGGDYGVTVSIDNISQLTGFDSSEVSIWGVPGDPSHHAARGWDCLDHEVFIGGAPEGSSCPSSAPAHANPFLLFPTSCTGPMKTTVRTDPWDEAGHFAETEVLYHDITGRLVGLDGCDRLDFEPVISAVPDGSDGSTPTGLTVGVHVPQEASLTEHGLGESDVKTTVVALPAGVQISPAGADGLLACSLGEVGLGDGVEAGCPEASKVGTVEISSPLLPNKLVGAAYLAAQNANPFGSLVALYLVAKDPVSGVLVKLAGKVAPDPVTGQLVSTFEDTPQLPFEELKLNFFGSARAPLSTPPLCGTYTSTASIEPWSGSPPATPSSSFQITSGPNGAPCSTPQPFTPGFQAGTTNIQAGAFTPFQLTMTRPDADQTLSRVEMQMPPGLLGTLSAVKLCGEPQAAQGTCGEESLIGHTIVSAGLGNDPYTVTGGKVFITGPYKGAPFGLSIVNPAKAGPFDLGTVVVRAQIRVDRHTAALSILSDPLPTILDGIPLQIQHVSVIVERPEGFTFNATDCNPMQITGTLSSTEGAAASVATRYQVTNCADLAFHPKFAVSTSGKTSRANGASLHVKLSYPTGPYDANIARVKVELPKRLPSRLTTLQKACPAATFEANPAACPAASLIGSATATTPVLPVPLTGPAYFVSHGGEAFPSLIVVLQGYGVTVDLVGSTFISKQGITSSTFKTVPDVPVGTFELTLPEGKYSALAANGNLCKNKLTMPTEFIGQNGLEIHQSTKIQVTGCPKTKHTTHTRKKNKAKGNTKGQEHGKRNSKQRK